MTISKVAFAALAGVSRAAITQGIKATPPLIIETPEGQVDTADPLNAAYLERKKAKGEAKLGRGRPPGPSRKTAPAPAKKAAPAKAPAPRAPDPAPEIPDIEEPDDEGRDDSGGLYIRKLKAEIRFKHEAAEAHRMRRLERMGLLVEREEVRKVIGAFNAELRIRLLELPQAIAPRLLALAKSGAAEHELIALLEDEIARGVDGAKGVVERSKVVGA